jgi:hypothetical protein
MTEAEWLACDEPKALVRYLIGTDAPRVQDVEEFPDCRTSDRKLRLFACACYHHIRHLLPHPEARAAVEVAQRFADGEVGFAKFVQTEARIRELSLALEGQWRASQGAERVALQPTHAALALAWQCLWDLAPKAAYYAPYTAQFYFAHITEPDAPNDPVHGSTGRTEARAQCTLLRDIFGNPFRPVAFDPAWRTDTAVALARQMYDSWDSGAMPILADALQEAGCDSDEVLGHCRGPGPHVRGCWVVDLVLGKE